MSGKLRASRSLHYNSIQLISSTQFKGEPKKKKRKHADIVAGPSAEGGSTSTADEADWISIPSPLHAHGPCYILSLPTEHIQAVTCLAVNPSLNRIFPHVFQENVTAADTAEPTDIHHVFVCTRIPEAEEKFTLRSSMNKFLAIDEHGAVSADREARGMQEEFSLEDAGTHQGVPTFAIKSVMYGKYLSIDEVAGGKLEYRGDAEKVGPEERFQVRMQSKFKGSVFTFLLSSCTGNQL